jgi:hypothetical protein
MRKFLFRFLLASGALGLLAGLCWSFTWLSDRYGLIPTAVMLCVVIVLNFCVGDYGHE